MGLVTLLGIARQGYFIPYRYAAKLPLPGRNPIFSEIEGLFADREAKFEDVLNLVDIYLGDLSKSMSAPPPAPRWTQDWFPRLDGATAYALIRHERPRKIIEIGSGHSTRFIFKAVQDGGFNCEIKAIDPSPRASLSGLGITFLQKMLQDVEESCKDLLAGDILFVDSSHVLMPGSDVDIILNRILPSLPDGVWIHFHDIFLPFDYPMEWAWRGYNEQNALISLISGRYTIEFASRYVVTKMPNVFSRKQISNIPLPSSARESSLWIRKGSSQELW